MRVAIISESRCVVYRASGLNTNNVLHIFRRQCHKRFMITVSHAIIRTRMNFTRERKNKQNGSCYLIRNSVRSFEIKAIQFSANKMSVMRADA